MPVDLTLPPTTKSQGNSLYVILTTPPAANDGIATLEEINEAIFAQCYIYGDMSVTPNQNTGEGPRKACSRFMPIKLGNVSIPAVDLSYSYMPQSLGTQGADGNELYEALEPGTQVTAAIFNGIDGQTGEVDPGDVFDQYLMEVGVRRKGRTGDDEYAEFQCTQSLVAVGGVAVVEDHALESES